MSGRDAVALQERSGASISSPKGGGAWRLGFVLAALGAAPLLASPAPLQDWPNHVAGGHVLAALLDGDPFWSQFYRFNTFLVPNAAVDLGLLGLRALGLPEALAASILLVVAYVVFVGGMVLLARALAAFDVTKVAIAVLLFYGVALFWGLVNYVLGVGLMWGLLAAWLGAGRARLPVAAVGAALLLFVHAIPAVVFPMLLACFDFARWRAGARPRSCASAPVALAVVVVVLRLLPGETGNDLALGYTGAGSVAAFLAWKLRILATIPFGGSRLQDAASLLAFASATLAVGLAARPRLSAGAALAVAALFLLVLAAPERLGTGSLLDVRLAALPLMLAAMAVRLRWRGGRARAACVAVVVGLTIARTGVIAVEWRRAAEVFAAFDAASASLPAGGVMVMAYGRPLESLSWTDIWSPGIQSIAAQVVRRGVFFPALFANPDQQPIALREPFAVLGQPWDFSDPGRRAASLAAIGQLCGDYRGVFVTVLYGGPPFQIVNACAP